MTIIAFSNIISYLLIISFSNYLRKLQKEDALSEEKGNYKVEEIPNHVWVIALFIQKIDIPGNNSRDESKIVVLIHGWCRIQLGMSRIMLHDGHLVARGGISYHNIQNPGCIMVV